MRLLIIADDGRAGMWPLLLHGLLDRLLDDQDHGRGREPDHQVPGEPVQHPGRRRDRHQADLRPENQAQVPASHLGRLCPGKE